MVCAVLYLQCGWIVHGVCCTEPAGSGSAARPPSAPVPANRLTSARMARSSCPLSANSRASRIPLQARDGGRWGGGVGVVRRMKGGGKWEGGEVGCGEGMKWGVRRG
jgi:hypothetical protein